MFAPFSVTSSVRRFEGASGWFYVPFGEAQCAALRPLVAEAWPALLKVRARVGEHEWRATVMPSKDGPLFVALTAPVRRRFGIEVGQPLTIAIEPL